MPTVDLAALLPSWELTLRSERKSAQTVKSYAEGVRAFLRYCEREGIDPEPTKPNVVAFTNALIDGGNAAATARSRQLGLRRFISWLVEEGEMATDPLLGIKPPKLDKQVIEPLTEDELKALIKTCQVTAADRANSGLVFRQRRDEAIIRFMLETGARAGEVVAITLPDLNLRDMLVTIRRGKGGKGRVVAFGPQTATAIDRYIRQARKMHSLAESSPMLWLGDRQKVFSYDGLHATLKNRAKAAGITGFHPHRMRHTAAHRWLAAGGSESGLMAMAGWERPDMLMRYTRARASARAADEARNLNLGDLK